MKRNLQIILLAVPAFVLAASCAKEIAPDGTKPVPEPDTKVFTAEFESVTKTDLNENRTPVWVAGDAIGVTTSEDANVPCTLMDASKGTFKAEDIIGGAPFYAVYPYAEDNVFDGDLLKASVPPVQKLASGQNVAPGAMVTACKSNSNILQFKNCVSLVEIAIPRTDITKVVVEATGKDENLTGVFTMDLSASPLNPAAGEEAEPTATLLPEGEAFEAGTYYISVIPGSIKEFSITFTNTSGEEVTVSKKADISFGRSAGVGLGSFFIYEIDTAADLIKWAKQRAKYTAWDVVNLNADIALTEKEAEQYVPANDFLGLFDGHGHRISGLSCPLFCNLRSAEVKDLVIEADIVTDGANGEKLKNDYGIGILAQYAYPSGSIAAATRPDSKIVNVKTYGSIEVDGLNVGHNYHIGGIVGATNGVPFTDCENHAAVTFRSGTISGSSTLRTGGIVGATQAASTAELTSCRNYGAVTVAAHPGVYVYAAGISGCNTQHVTYERCVNYGNVEASETIASGSYMIAGICGLSSGVLQLRNCKNEGEIRSLASKGAAVYTGGLAGKLEATGSEILDSENSGVITCGTPTETVLYIGGLSACCSGTAKISGSSNAADLNCCGNTAKYVYFGGLVGSLMSDSSVISDSVNSGKLDYGTDAGNRVDIGGIIGFTGDGGTEGGYILQNVTNNGDININGTSANNSSSEDFRIGGLVGNLSRGGKIGYNSSAAAPCYNYGNITVNSAQKKLIRIGGACGSTTNKAARFHNVHNRGDISLTIAGGVTCAQAQIGGIAGYTGSGALDMESCSSRSEISKSGTVTTEKIAVILGYTWTKGTISNCGVGGSLTGTAITSENMNTASYIYKSGFAAGSEGVTVTGTYLCE